MDMTARFVFALTLLLPVFAAQAADAQSSTALTLTPKTFQSGMTKYIKEIPQCASAKLAKASLMKDGQVVYQQLKLDGAEVDILLDVNKAGKISNAKFTGPADAKDESQLQLMMCSTYAIMRTLQPEYESPAQAQRNMTHLWKSAASKPFKMAFYFNSIKAQYVPFEMNVF